LRIERSRKVQRRIALREPLQRICDHWRRAQPEGAEAENEQRGTQLAVPATQDEAENSHYQESRRRQDHGSGNDFQQDKHWRTF